ncbi:MAG: acyl-ACP thioesterase [Hyphomicrobiales bacterium]
MRFVSLRSTVNTWECDENAHMNVQFYFAKFDDADRILRSRFSLPSLTREARKTRHVRYHREAAAATMLEVRSAIILKYDKPVAVAHRMTNEPDRFVLATALDTYDANTMERISNTSHLPFEQWDNVLDALPKGLTLEAATTVSDTATTMPTYNGVFHPKDFSADGHLLDRAYISCFTDGAPHTWWEGGIEPQWLKDNGYGRVAVELKLTYAETPPPGVAVTMETAFTEVRNSTFTVRHTLSCEGVIVGYGDQVSLMMDLEKRKALPLPARAQRMRQLAGI